MNQKQQKARAKTFLKEYTKNKDIFLWKLKFISSSASNSFCSLKLDFYLPKKSYFILFKESPSKIMKNTFYFILKALFVLKVLNFLSCFFTMYKNSLIRNIRLISKFVTSQPVVNNNNAHIAQYLTK